MLFLSSSKSRLFFLLILLPIVSLVLYCQSLQQSNFEHAFPTDVLRDYTSPSTYCYWPNSATDGSSLKEGTSGKIKDWIGWGTSVKNEVDKVEHDESWKEEESFEWDGKLPDIIPSSGIEKYMLSHIEDLQDGFDPNHDFEEYGLKLGNITLKEYTRELISTYKEYLSPSSSSSSHYQNKLFSSSIKSEKIPKNDSPTWLSPVLSRLSLRPPISSLPFKPKQIITTDKSDKLDDLPYQFKRWSEIMPDYSIKYFNDQQLKQWVHDVFGNSKSEKIWLNLPRQVLKTDIFRYMVMLVEGAAPIIHADDWGKPYHSETAPLLTHLSRLLSLSTSQHLPSSHPLSSFSSEHAIDVIEGLVDFPQSQSNIYDGPIVDDGNELGEPALVVSVESDAVEFGWTNWREIGLSRAVQITQWTFMARPGHPVFLDALGRTLRKSEEIERKMKEGKGKGEQFVPESALEWTGPGVFTDCVYRYLLARYGFKPDQLIHVKEPIRVGDVLILPAGSYSSVSPFTDEEQRPWAASYHGFLGRWREADPAVQEFEKLKKEKEQAEEAEKKAKEEAENEAKEAEEKTDRVVHPESEEESFQESGGNEEVQDGDGIPRGRIGKVPLSPIG
ncbi:uncharacterized protein L201_004299 [Kwoniella dendrophila CBS 6074]|uniref:Glycosyltransferase n=1 Tax=Kwoniella dendrophila CBS 6074 TaxID=1295534 RepID=A0AAX4JVU3_9TREE